MYYSENRKKRRKPYDHVELSLCKELLDGMAATYLFHRYDAASDKHFWPAIVSKLTRSGQVIAHMDYSENLKESSKLATQEQYFSGEDHSLHCAVIHHSELPADNTYV